MTCDRKDGEGTQLGLWLRKQKEIDSYLGYNTSNLDYIWTDKCGNILLIEEKRYMGLLTNKQREIFFTLDKIMSKAKEGYKKDDNLNLLYRGFYLVQFQYTSPDDGNIYVNGNFVLKNKFIEFLKFKFKIDPFDFSIPYYDK